MRADAHELAFTVESDLESEAGAEADHLTVFVQSASQRTEVTGHVDLLDPGTFPDRCALIVAPPVVGRSRRGGHDRVAARQPTHRSSGVGGWLTATVKIRRPHLE